MPTVGEEEWNQVFRGATRGGGQLMPSPSPVYTRVDLLSIKSGTCSTNFAQLIGEWRKAANWTTESRHPAHRSWRHLEIKDQARTVEYRPTQMVETPRCDEEAWLKGSHPTQTGV